MLLNAALDNGTLDLMKEIHRSMDVFRLSLGDSEYTLLLSLQEKEMEHLIEVASKQKIRCIAVTGGSIKGSKVRVNVMLFQRGDK